MTALFLSRWFPYPADNGSKLRIYNLIKALAAAKTVDLISFYQQPVSEEALAEMRRYCRRVEALPYIPFRPGGWKARLGFLSPLPRSVLATRSAAMERYVQRALQEEAYDVVIASQIDMAPYAAGLKGAANILEEIELTTLYEQYARQGRPLARFRRWLTWQKTARYAARMARLYRGCTVVSAGERRRLLELAPGYDPLEIIPNGVDLQQYAGNYGEPRPDTLLYSGALTYQANFDAVDFFLRQIFPLILAQRPAARLVITGSQEGAPLDRLPSGEALQFTGYLEDIRPQVAQSWVSVVPLRVGGGTRLKILESLALGTPVVATAKGAEGLELEAGRHLLIADEPEVFARHVLDLLQNRRLRDEIGGQGKQQVGLKYNWQDIGKKFNRFVDEIVLSNSRQPEEDKHGQD